MEDWKLKQLEEELRHEQEVRKLQGSRLDAPDVSFGHVSSALDTITSRIDLITTKIEEVIQLQKDLSVSQAKTDEALRNLIQIVTSEHGNGRQK